MTQNLSISELTTAVHHKFSTVIIKTPCTNDTVAQFASKHGDVGRVLLTILVVFAKTAVVLHISPNCRPSVTFRYHKTSYCELSKMVFRLYFVANVYKM